MRAKNYKKGSLWKNELWNVLSNSLDLGGSGEDVEDEYSLK